MAYSADQSPNGGPNWIEAFWNPRNAGDAFEVLCVAIILPCNSIRLSDGRRREKVSVIHSKRGKVGWEHAADGAEGTVPFSPHGSSPLGSHRNTLTIM